MKDYNIALTRYRVNVMRDVVIVIINNKTNTKQKILLNEMTKVFTMKV